jgi:hypothetical protein
MIPLKKIVRSDDPLTPEEICSVIVALRMFSSDLTGESPYSDALKTALAKLEALVEKGKR